MESVFLTFWFNSNSIFHPWLGNKSSVKVKAGKDIEAFTNKLAIRIKPELTNSELEKCYELYLAVKKNNLGLNTFNYPYALFQHMNVSIPWEFILVYLKDMDMRLVGVMFCYKNSNNIYTPAVVGMDYEFSREYNVYRQLLYQTILRAREVGSTRIDFGLTAGFEKRKVGARVLQKCAYLQTRDNFALEALDWLRND
ncbi:GNAT family N-acetyltransferase [Gramella sp. AN32]|uniref:GNAT family N-acetyltransferase n=1 Tax=Christiangramia antarctica TaxID=2058158 RepID=A0ABW5X920_9FLAO|nr:GNAT family N-acetyltransferase [Gramella sp. AN32]